MTSPSTAGTKIRSNRSVKRCVGDACVSASRTIVASFESVGIGGEPGDLQVELTGAVDRAREQT